MYKELTNIKFLPIIEEKKICFDDAYKYFCNNQLFLDKFKNFKSTNITGVYDNTRFLLYKDYKNTNRLCIVFVEGKSYTIVCIDSASKDHYFEECNYYSELNNNNFFIETRGLGNDSSNYCKFKLEKNGTKYTICLSNDEIIGDSVTYKYEMTLKSSNAESHVCYLWDNYSDFNMGKHPRNIKLFDKIKCIRSDFVMTNYDSYNAGDGPKTYSYINSMIESLGFISYDNAKRYIGNGINIHDGIIQIVERYLLLQKEIDSKELVSQEHYEENRKKIAMTVAPKSFDESQITSQKKL